MAATAGLSAGAPVEAAIVPTEHETVVVAAAAGAGSQVHADVDASHFNIWEREVENVSWRFPNKSGLCLWELIEKFYLESAQKIRLPVRKTVEVTSSTGQTTVKLSGSCYTVPG